MNGNGVRRPPCAVEPTLVEYRRFVNFSVLAGQNDPPLGKLTPFEPKNSQKKGTVTHPEGKFYYQEG